MKRVMPNYPATKDIYWRLPSLPTGRAVFRQGRAVDLNNQL